MGRGISTYSSFKLRTFFWRQSFFYLKCILCILFLNVIESFGKLIINEDSIIFGHLSWPSIIHVINIIVTYLIFVCLWLLPRRWRNREEIVLELAAWMIRKRKWWTATIWGKIVNAVTLDTALDCLLVLINIRIHQSPSLISIRCFRYYSFGLNKIHHCSLLHIVLLIFTKTWKIPKHEWLFWIRFNCSLCSTRRSFSFSGLCWWSLSSVSVGNLGTLGDLGQWSEPGLLSWLRWSLILNY